MRAITYRLPTSKYERLKQLAKSQNISVNRLIDELSTMALASYDAKTSFALRARKGDKKRGLEILEKL